MTTLPTLFDAADWEPLVETLRAELQEYGGLFNLLSQQQNCIVERKSDQVLALNSDIETQMGAVASVRGRREEMVQALHTRAGDAHRGSLRRLVPYFPEVVRPLLEALITDVNHMVRRNRQKARQNHLLLSRAMELTEQTLRLLQPEDFTRTYQRDGKVALARRPAAAARYQAVG